MVRRSPLPPAPRLRGLRQAQGVGICAADSKIVRTKGRTKRTSQYWRLPLSQSPSTILEKAVFEAADDGAPGRSGSGTVTALRSRSPSPAPPRRKSAGGVPVPEADEAIHVGLERINACQLLEARLDIGVSVSSQMAPRDAPSVPLLTLIHRLLVARAYALRGVGPFRMAVCDTAGATLSSAAATNAENRIIGNFTGDSPQERNAEYIFNRKLTCKNSIVNVPIRQIFGSLRLHWQSETPAG